MTAACPDFIDRHVGAMIKLRRKILSLTQSALAARVGAAVDHLDACERGRLPVPPSMLWRCAAVLHCDVDWFFEGLPDQPARSPADGDERRD